MSEDRFLPVSLPSDGRTYPELAQNIRVRSMCGADEVLLAQMNPMNVERRFLELLRRVVHTEDPNLAFKVEDITFGDRLYLMLWLSINSLQDRVKVTTVCPNCFKDYQADVDLRTINVIHLPETFAHPSHPLTLSDGSTVVLRLLTVGDLADVEKYSMDHEDGVVYKYALTIVSGSVPMTTQQMKMKFYSDLSTKDTAKIRAYQEAHFHGPDMQTTTICPACKVEDKIEVPFRLELLFPTGEELRTNFGA